MKDYTYIAGAGMTRFTTHSDKTYSDLAAMATDKVLKDAGLQQNDIQAVFFSNTSWGHFEAQHSIRGQVALRPYGLLTPPIMNVENGCASGSSALYIASMAVKSGEFDVVLCLGVEKLVYPDKNHVYDLFKGGYDVANYQDTLNLHEELTKECRIPAGQDDSQPRSAALDTYGVMARWHMSEFGTTQEQLARIAVKNRFNGSLNPLAHWQKEISLEQVMNDPVVSFPITRPMCAPIGDGAGAVILVSERYLKRLSKTRAVKVRSIVHTSGTAKRRFEETQDIGERLSKMAYEKAGVGPEDIDIAEVHDATTYGELRQVESLGFTPEGTGGEFVMSGISALNGAKPVNTSGGLIARGHPVGVSGLAQVIELVTQIRGEAGRRQVPKKIQMGLAENGGGILTLEEASMTITIVEKI